MDDLTAHVRKQQAMEPLLGMRGIIPRYVAFQTNDAQGLIDTLVLQPMSRLLIDNGHNYMKINRLDLVPEVI